VSALVGRAQTYHEANSTYVSCCVAVRNMQRNVFVLPREKKLGRTRHCAARFSQRTRELTTGPLRCGGRRAC